MKIQVYQKWKYQPRSGKSGIIDALLVIMAVTHKQTFIHLEMYSHIKRAICATVLLNSIQML